MVDERDVLPAEGIWSVEDLAKYLKTQPGDLLQKLTDKGIKVLHLGTRHKMKLIRMEDLRYTGTGKHDMDQEEPLIVPGK